ncbi:hypothetical protein Q8791_10910 [Nocardiopsis sp. CT-R113]|uniref:Uncharacterized protein n=1 Tax=Nocardiopsis codii TaxID=3065942 RepID=A0ABU7K654_9ACTN|nr:hypothetical protein [Nocardiopsis sp. CT-R113]MEE2037730.1 hypothetical protein [Nocardiopsis sp. CT-R113]
MRLSSRALTTVVLALGIALGAPAVAAADARFQSVDSFAGPQGASITVIRSVVGDDGKVTYKRVTYFAGPDGAQVFRSHSAAK